MVKIVVVFLLSQSLLDRRPEARGLRSLAKVVTSTGSIPGYKIEIRRLVECSNHVKALTIVAGHSQGGRLAGSHPWGQPLGKNWTVACQL